MDAISQGIVAGVIANGLTAIIPHLTRKRIDFPSQKESLQRPLESDGDIASILQRATASIARSPQCEDRRYADTLRLFLVSPEVDAIVRQVYASQVSTGMQRHLASIRTEFLASLSLRLGAPQDSCRELAETLFDALFKGCERALESAVEQGVLSAHDLKSASRIRLILDELSGIQKNLAHLTAPISPNIEAILEFEGKYRNQVGSRHGYITPPHFDAARKLPIDELYVSSDFIRLPRKKGEEASLLNSQDFLMLIYRVILLGNPGGGKSTLTHMLCHGLSTQYSQRVLAGRQITPILVILREYGAEKKARGCSILQFIEMTANSRYQVQPPPGAFEYLLLNGRVFLIFDGLDELLDTSYRQEISGDVESFCSLYPSVPVLVTSREVGYEQAPLDDKRFEIFRISPFNEAQVREYVTKWFSADSDLTPLQQKQQGDAFIQESRIVSDLRANPLMLALMCNIYRGENYIPRNRPDVYEKCAVMLFERWDKSRGIHVPLPFEAHISPAMKFLAHWIYADEALQGGVTEQALVAKATDYLCSWRFEDRDEAERAAREFIDFCRGRAWVFTDTGTTKEGERLYQFTHRTFLEYFTAGHLVRTHATPSRLATALTPRIASREWDVVAQLAFQLQHKNVEGAGDELLTDLIAQGRQHEGPEGRNFLSFAARCLEFIVPRPKVAREIALACLESALAWGLKQMQREGDRDRAHGSFERYAGIELLGCLHYAAAENRTVIADTMEKVLIERIMGNSDHESLLAIEIGLHRTWIYEFRPGERRPQREVADFWAGISDRIFETCSDRIVALGQEHFEPCIDSFWRGKVSFDNLVAWHGIGGIFRLRGFLTVPAWSSSIAEMLLGGILGFRYFPDRPIGRIHSLEEAGRILITSPPPWVRGRTLPMGILPDLLHHQERVEKEGPGDFPQLSSEALFGVFALLSVLLESSEDRKELSALIERIKESRHPLFDCIRWTTLGRFELEAWDRISSEVNRCGFTADQQAFVWRWIRREIDLVRRAPRRDKRTPGKSAGQ